MSESVEGAVRRQMSEVQVLKQFFGYRPDQTGAQFLKELQQMPADERATLARVVARQLNVDLAE